jgi:hypothetical protein
MSIPKFRRVCLQKFIIIDDKLYGCVFTGSVLAWCNATYICKISEAKNPINIERIKKWRDDIK